MTTEVASELESFCNGKIGKVLVSEGYYFALRDVAGEFVLAGIGETAQLNALNLSTDCGSEMGDLCVGFNEVGKARVGIFAVFVVLEGLEGRIDLVFVPCGEIVGILTSRWVNNEIQVGYSDEKGELPLQQHVHLLPFPRLHDGMNSEPTLYKRPRRDRGRASPF